jgi:hypothetical protein
MEIALPLALPGIFPVSLPALIPDMYKYLIPGRIGLPRPEDLLFFDLETTGLSGGAGILAFLAAFARPVPGGALQVNQYLLLDYPGEGDFLEALLAEFRPGQSLVVSYNGKSFDSQILKIRCRMNGMEAPDFFHADLLHPARRLWKAVLPNCSQAEIEGAILGLRRQGDIPGALAPEIWFGFLKTGETGDLEGIADHNLMDVRGLAAVFSAMVRIASNPEGSSYRADTEQLALIWRAARDRLDPPSRETGERLLAAAAAKGCPRALYCRSRDLFVNGREGEGRELLSRLAAGGAYSSRIRAFALRTLAVDAEWRLGDTDKALSLTGEALTLREIPDGLRKDLEKRKKRLLEKTGGA